MDPISCDSDLDSHSVEHFLCSLKPGKPSFCSWIDYNDLHQVQLSRCITPNRANYEQDADKVLPRIDISP